MRILRKEITKRIPLKKAVALTFDIYDGFENIEKLETQMCSLGIFEKQYMIVLFCGQYYGVVNHSSDTALVYGKNDAWIKELNIWRRESSFNLVLPFTPKSLLKGQTSNSEILNDMATVDPNFQVLNGYKTGWRDVRGLYQYADRFAELLGRTFYSTLLNHDTIHVLKLYDFSNEANVLKNLDNPRVQGVNPFRTEALFKSGKIHRIMI